MRIINSVTLSLEGPPAVSLGDLVERKVLITKKPLSDTVVEIEDSKQSFEKLEVTNGT